MNGTFNFVVIEEELRRKYATASMQERYFNADDYMWVLGHEVWRRLWFEYLRKPVPATEDAPNHLMGIRVRVDESNSLTIKLYKEIK